jgi:transcriptional regulator with PAS, ATPase and Fis domain
MENEYRVLQNENRVLKTGMKERYKFGDIIGRSQAMQSVYERVSKAAAVNFHVVVYGESGTGKELVARTIRNLSDRMDEPFVAVNCSAISETLFEREFFGHRKGSFTDASQDQQGYFDAANGGILFLDELGELKPEMQVKLLRVLENGEYIPVGGTKSKRADVRIISATNKDLPSLVAEGKFREDLFYRIHVVEIVVPPLRERKKDIPLLIDYFLSRFCASAEPPLLPGNIRDVLYHYDWPGNIRELQNTIQRFLATNELIMPGGRTINVEENRNRNPDTGLNHAIETLERKMILDILQKTNWHRGKTAEILDIPRRTLQRKMLKYGFRKNGEDS